MSPVGFLSGLTVHQLRVGYDLRLVSCSDENDVEVVMEAPCFVTDPGGTEHRIERDNLGTIPALLALQSRVITEVSADNGSLRAVFDDGSTLMVPPLDQYEAGHVEGPGDRGVVCMPGGELAVWDE